MPLFNPRILQSYFLVALIATSLALSFFVFRPFLVVLVLAAVFAVLLYSPYRRVVRSMNTFPGLAAFITIAVALVCILIPLTFIGVQIVGDAQHLSVSLSEGDGKMYLDRVSHTINNLAAQYVPSLALSSTDLSATVDQYIKDGLTWLLQNIAHAFGSVARLLISFFIFLIALYYLLRDGMKWKHLVIEMSPLANADTMIVFERLELAVTSVLRGSLTIALIQGVLTGIGFTVFGIPNSILWGMVAAIAALVPTIGTSLVIVPGVVYLFITGAIVPAFGLLIWGVFAVGLIDNFLGPRIIGRGMKLHPLAVFLSVFGGLVFFGPAGIFLGPLCTSFLFALVSIYPSISKQTE